MKMKVYFKKLDGRAHIPTYGTPYSAGTDLYAVLDEEKVIAPGTTEFIGTGLAVELPMGTVGLVYARSGLACKSDLAPANKVGVIDCDYRGEIKVALHNHGAEPRTVRSGDRIAQMVITPYIVAEYEECGELSDTVRGEGGFGSTGSTR